MLEPLPEIRTPQRVDPPFARHLPASVALGWLRAGVRDVRREPGASLSYGIFLVLASYAVLSGLWAAGLLYLALPAIAGFLIVGPFLALGLYEKSRLQSTGTRITLMQMVVSRPVSGGQMAYLGLLLALLVLFWLRAADLLYALFFGLSPFPGAGEALINVLATTRGWGLILVGTMVGGLFAALAFALSLFSVPMLMTENRDALTALGLSFAMTTQNIRPCLGWGAIVVAGMMISVATGLLALAVVFPVLGHGTWHAWRSIREPVR